ncbi:Ldh family oxidoreductase [Allonocardiopsis opalescens]|uniref:LDH2 family malate/lactate/ureidoglycolate dehydrogenase n=1 Tax=Allonocardiopsis opalescens TaxID=1144618 RepID=A0A2T0QEN0_9ACTN|nr:Ldh family oxidoreductase [Allonocardiopsis opalescens]PRY02378.1 LDH2 family malate/lactate/ureidoglycolate dehydrogenase [Allonocardiopsis opalescens]
MNSPAPIAPPDRGAAPADPASVRVPHDGLLAFTAAVFADRGLPPGRAGAAARALCHGDLTGLRTHGLANLTRLYLPLLDEGRADPRAELRVLADRGAAVLLDAGRALGLWAAGAAMDLAAERAAAYGIGLAAVRGGTHLGCAGHHALRAVARGMVGLVASNCGRQRIARPPGGAVAMLGTNPLSVAAPAGENPPFVLDMSTTAAPTGRVRQAAREGRALPEGLLCDDRGAPVTDPAAFDAGRAHLMWLGGEAGRYKGYGLGLTVEVLAALVPGAGLGPHPDALAGDGGPHGRDDDIGYFVAAVDPGALREGAGADAEGLFGALLACPPADPAEPVRYPGWHEHHRAQECRRRGVPLAADLYDELLGVAARTGLTAPPVLEEGR